MKPLPLPVWWQRDDLAYQDGELRFAGRSVPALARQFSGPAFFYSFARVQQNLARVRGALRAAELPGEPQILYAMKANRFAPLLTALAQSGVCGIDACSPAEVEHALSCGFRPTDISFTAGSLSARDFDRLVRHPGLQVNLDSLSALAGWGRRMPGSVVGIRINPGAGVSRESNDKLRYAGDATTKFGIYREQFPEALEICAAYGLQLRTIHLHTGCGYLTAQLGTWERVLESCDWFLDAAPSVTTVNVGGGLGVPHLPGEQPLDLREWAAVLQRRFGVRGLRIQVEPGDYIAKDAGLLIMERTYEETRRNTRFVGVNAGFNIAPEPAHYGLPFQPVPLHYRGESCTPAHVAGNINEALDVWYADALLPPLDGQDHLALINAGAYSSSMASNHCMRGEFQEYLLL